MYGETLDFQCHYQNGNVKYPVGKLILPLKLFPATVANADIRSLKSLQTFLKECLDHIVKFDNVKIVWSKLHKMLSFLTKNRVF